MFAVFICMREHPNSYQVIKAGFTTGFSSPLQGLAWLQILLNSAITFIKYRQFCKCHVQLNQAVLWKSLTRLNIELAIPVKSTSLRFT